MATLGTGLAVAPGTPCGRSRTGIALVPAAIGGALVGDIAALIVLVMRGQAHSEGGGHA